MKLFALKPQIHQFGTFAEFAAEFKLGSDDLVLTHEFIYEPTMRELNLQCRFVFQEHYGSGEPSDEMADKILADLGDQAYRRVVAIGGGTVIDIAKLFVLEGVRHVVDVFERRIPLKKVRELVIVPTTCGTGSEVTNLSIFELKSLHTKLGLAVDELSADHAVLIPHLLNSLPHQFFVYSSIDALIHACESFVAPRANSYSELFSIGAITRILHGYRFIIEHGQDQRSALLEDMLVASNMAGIAFGNAGTGAVHALSYPIGSNYHVPHGESNYIFFLEVFRAYERSDGNDRLAELKGVLAAAMDVDPTGDVFTHLGALLQQILPTKRLREYGVEEETLGELTDSVIANQQRLLRNAFVPLTRGDILLLLSENVR